MPPSVLPLSEVPAELLREFLGRVGMPPEVADWRYLDQDFNRGRNRGFAWLRRDRIEGMIGLIPFQITGPGHIKEVTWSSDWILSEPSRNPGMGILLLRRAIESSRALFALGGNENTRKLLPRIATHVVPDAALAMHLFLRSGAILRRAGPTGRLGRLLQGGLLSKIPLRWVPGAGSSSEVRTQEGVSGEIVPLLDGAHREGWSPRYDFTYVSWQIGRSPLIRCCTSYCLSQGEPGAAAVYWSPAASSDFWRIAVWYQPSCRDRLDVVLRHAVSEIYRRGGMAVSAIVSRLDTGVQAALRARGFLPLGRRRPLYVCAGQDPSPVPELSGLSYLDSDLAYRF
jgi:hypothetical protein